MSKCNDKWTSKDKALHFCVCFVLAIISPMLAVICAVGKEAWDYHKDGNHWCWKDLVWDAVGVVIGSIIYLI